MRVTLSRVLALVACFWAGTSLADPARPAVSADELSKQRAIYQSRGEDVPEGYVINRSLSSYLYALPAGLGRSLASLGPEDRWLDIGAGEGRAIIDYCTSKYDGTLLREFGEDRKKARAVAMSIEDRRTPQWYETAASLGKNQMQYLFGKPLRDYSGEELGKFQVITDVVGGFSYTQSLSVFMEKTLSFLDLHGSFYTLLQDVSSEAGTNSPYYPGASFLTEIVNADGSHMSVCAWLKSITCVEVTCQHKPGWTPPIEVYHVRKVCNDVRVPGLTPIHFEAGTPPERRYRLARPAAAPSDTVKREAVNATR